MILNYSYIRRLGGNLHRIKLYESFAEDTGLTGKPKEQCTSSRFSDLKKNLKPFLTPDQMKQMSVRSTGKYSHLVIGEDGKTLESNL